MLIIVFLACISSQAAPTFPNVDAVTKDFYETPSFYNDVEFPDKGDILWIKYDITQDGRDDILISGRNLLTGESARLAWSVYAGTADGQFRKNLMFGKVFDPEYLLVVTDDTRGRQLATVLHMSAYESAVSLLLFDGDEPSSNVDYGTISTDSPEDGAWVEEHRREAAALINVVPSEELLRKYGPPLRAEEITQDTASPPASAEQARTPPESTPVPEETDMHINPPSLATPANQESTKEQAQTKTEPVPTESRGGIVLCLAVLLMALVGFGVLWKRRK